MSSKKKHSFTIIELAIIAAAIAIFAGIAIAYFDSVTTYSRDSKRRTDIDALRKAIMVQSNMGSKKFTVETDWCCVGATNDADRCGNLENALKGYISSIPRDPHYVPESMMHCYMYKSSGDDFELYTALESGNVVYYSKNLQSTRDLNALDCVNIEGEDEWVKGPGFCVMKYEARKSVAMNCKDSYENDAYCPVSNATPVIWNNISFNEAVHACESIGAHLITNAEWMALAHSVYSEGENWVNGVLKSGNTGISDETNYNMGNIDTGNSNSLARLKLPSGDFIWHFSGNLAEWVHYKENFEIPIVGSWKSYSDVDINNFGKIGYYNIGPKDKSKATAVSGVGQIRTTSTGEYFLRGGGYANTFNAGAYSLELVDEEGVISTGFRCVK